MKKICFILILFILMIPSIKSFDKTLKVYDYNQSITKEEEEKLKNKINKYIKKYNIDMSVITVKHYEKDTTREYILDFFKKNNLGNNSTKDALIFVLDYSEEINLEIFTNGKANDIYTKIVIDEMKHSVNLENNSYKIFIDLINKSEKYINNYNEVSKYIVFNKISKKEYAILLIISLFISATITFILVLKSKTKKDVKKQKKNIDMHMIKSQDKFVNTHTEAYRYGNKKGFTLIELLAVIVILAIIALIAVPIVLNIINDSKYESQKRSIDLYAEALKQSVANYQLKTNKKVEGKFNTTDGKTLTRDGITLNVDYKGNVVCNRTIVNKDGSIYVGVCTVDGIKVDYEVGETTYGMMAENKAHSDNFLNTNIDSNYIIKFTIHTDGMTIPEGYESTDCSYNHDESVICYWKIYSQDSYYNYKYYDMHLASDGEIYTPYDSSYLFYNLGSAFYSNLTKVDLNGINTKYTTNMSYMFNRLGDRHLKELNLGNKFDTSNVTNMEGMFSDTGYYALEKLDLGNKFDTSKVTTMEGMFSDTGHEKMVSLNLGNKFDTSNVTNMEGMFLYTGYYALEKLDLGNKFDTSNATDMGSMFYRTGYNVITSLDLGDKFDTSNVTNMSQMFYETGYGSMTNLNLGPNFNTSNVTDMRSMFYRTGYNAMTSLDLGPNFNTSKVTDMSSMFYQTGYNKLEKLDLGKLFVVNTSTQSYNLYYNNMFEGTGHNSMKELYLWNFSNYIIAKTYNRNNMFKDCGNEGILTKVVVSTDDFKNTLINDSNAPQFWKDNNIIQVQS